MLFYALSVVVKVIKLEFLVSPLVVCSVMHS